MAYQDRPPSSDGSSEPRAVVGWTHRPLRNGIELEIESSRSLRALEAGEVDRARLCMTRNQALLLARYLLQATGQDRPEPARRPSLLMRLKRRFG